MILRTLFLMLISTSLLAGEYGTVEAKRMKVISDGASIAGANLMGTYGKFRVGAGAYANVSELEQDVDSEFEFWYAGVILGYAQPLTNRLQIASDLLIGGASLNLRDKVNSEVEARHRFDVAELKLYGKFQIVPMLNLALGGYYFYSTEFYTKTMKEDAIGTTGVSVGLEFGQ